MHKTSYSGFNKDPDESSIFSRKRSKKPELNLKLPQGSTSGKRRHRRRMMSSCFGTSAGHVWTPSWIACSTLCSKANLAMALSNCDVITCCRVRFNPNHWWHLPITVPPLAGHQTSLVHRCDLVVYGEPRSLNVTPKDFMNCLHGMNGIIAIASCCSTCEKSSWVSLAFALPAEQATKDTVQRSPGATQLPL